MAAVYPRVSLQQAISEEPAYMCMKQPLQRAMRITVTVGLGMMLGMGCCPSQRWSLEPHGAKDEENKLDDRMRPETAMCQHPMKTNRLTQLHQRVHCSKEYQIGPADSTLPEQYYS